MSGPIVRKYGFPNFEKIFGERPILHGADESTPDAKTNEAASKSEAAPVEKSATPDDASKKLD